MSRPLIFGMVHLRALPGTPLNKLPYREIKKIALQEANVLFKNQCDGVIVENMSDVPYQKPSQRGPETCAMMSDICSSIRSQFQDQTLGVQVLSCGNKEALAIAAAADLDFIRLESYVFGHIGDEGFTESNAAETLRYRKTIGAENIKVLTDIKKKHSSHSITADVSIADTAVAAEFFLSDGVIVTGSHTGVAADPEELKVVKETVNIPVFIGSGVSADNISNFKFADGLIIGSEFKKNGFWRNELDEDRIKKIVNANKG